MIFGLAVRRNAIRIEGDRSASLDTARGRLVLISAFFALTYIVMAVRLFDLMVIQGELGRWGQGERAEYVMSERPESSAGVPETVRADIRDRNGALMATTLKTASLYADTKLISDAEQTARALVRVFRDLSYGDVLQKLQSGKRFIWIKRNILPDEQYEVLKIGEPGLEFEYENRRVYTQGPLAAHIVGYTNVDGKGLAGVERSFDNFLAEGRPLDLTIDVRLQHAVRRELARAVREFRAKGGVGIVMDVQTGEVLAGVSLPDFDPHAPGHAKKQEMFNRLTLGVYELGSVFKIFSTAVLFEDKNVPMGTKFDASEPIKRGRFTINDYHAEDRILTVPEVFMYSSNIGSAMMGEAVGTQRLKDFYEDLGLFAPLDIEIGEIGRPMVPDPWRDINTLTASYGHGISTTPMQLTAAVASIVNGGYLVKPTLIRSTEPSLETIRIVSEKTSRKMRSLLRLVVTDGTGRSAEVPGYLVGGKTGTAEQVVDGRYDRSKLLSSFIGVFPSDEPRYAVFVAVDEPKGNKASYGFATGGWVAAPAVARVIGSMASVLAIPPRTVREQDDIANPLKRYVSDRRRH